MPRVTLCVGITCMWCLPGRLQKTCPTHFVPSARRNIARVSFRVKGRPCVDAGLATLGLLVVLALGDLAFGGMDEAAEVPAHSRQVPTCPNAPANAGSQQHPAGLHSMSSTNVPHALSPPGGRAPAVVVAAAVAGVANFLRCLRLAALSPRRFQASPTASDCTPLGVRSVAARSRTVKATARTTICTTHECYHEQVQYRVCVRACVCIRAGWAQRRSARHRVEVGDMPAKRAGVRTEYMTPGSAASKKAHGLQ